jgi:isopentenyl-diphosphate delta-isomerase
MSIALKDNPTQRLICVDADGRETGRVVDRKTAHSTPGVKHLAIQVVVFNSAKELVLHERPMTKVGGGVLDSPTTHVLAGETPQEAAARCLRNEYGVSERLRIRIVKGFAYDKDYGDGSCENEFCLSSFAVYDGPIRPNRDQVVKIVRLPAQEVLQDLLSRPENFPVWFKRTIGFIKADPEAARFFT